MTKLGTSRIIISIHFLLTMFVVTRYFRSRYQLSSPIVPITTKEEILKSFYFDMTVLGLAFLISITLYFFSKNLLSILISIFAVLYVSVYYL